MKKVALIILSLSLLFVFCSCNVNVNSIELTDYKETIKVGEKFRIKYSVNFEDESVLFVSSNTKVATVDLTGVVQGVGVGDTTITVKLSSNKDISTSFTLNVTSRYNKEDFANIPLDEDLWHIKYLEEGSDVETIYMLLRKKISDVARGKETRTSFQISNVAINDFNILDYSIMKAVGMLWLNCPYDLYWYEEQSGFTYDYNIKGDTIDLTVRMPVCSDYRKSQYEVDENRKEVALIALINANAIASAAPESDYDRIMYFKNKICDLVTYDTSSNNAQIAGKTKCGNNPWQMISVFDDDTSTNVVCAGYSKAFKYLCDKVGIECKVVNGEMNGYAHVWNVVTLEGKNYIVDVTNCDGNSSGRPDKLMLVGAKGSIEKGYTDLNVGLKYRYYTDNDPATSMLLVFSEEGLTISDTSYKKH